MSEALAIAPAPAAAPAEPTVSELAALIPDSAYIGDSPSVAPSPAPAPTENTADAADAARLNKPNEQPAEQTEPPPPEGEQKAEAQPAPEPVDTEALERAEQAAKRAREGSRRYREMLAEQARVREEAQRQAQAAEQYRREAEEAKRLREEWKKDPYKALKSVGMTDQELAERALREGTPEALIHEVREQLEQERQARAALEQRLESERAELARQRAQANFARIADNEASYPRLAQLDGTAQLAIARAALAQIESNGYDVRGLSDEQVAEACERFLTPKRGAAAKPAPKPSTPPPAAKPQTAATSKTLTNAVSTQRAVAPREWHEMTDDEQIAAIAAALPDPT